MLHEDGGGWVLEQRRAGDHGHVDVGVGQCLEQGGETLEQRIGPGRPGGEDRQVGEVGRDEVVADLAVESPRGREASRSGNVAAPLASTYHAWRSFVATSATRNPRPARAAAKFAATVSCISPTGEVTTIARGSWSVATLVASAPR